MRHFAFLTALLFALAACGEEHDHSADDGHDHAAEEEGAHEEHAAQNGGELLELGEHEGHAEVKLDHDNGVLALWLWNAEMKPWTADKPPVLNFTLDGKPHSLTAEGEGAEWMFTHEALKGEPENVRFRVSAGGTTYQAQWMHQHDHDHDHG
jgi:hypothetical protein